MSLDYTLTNLERLKFALNGKQYYDDYTYKVILAENKLDPDETYDNKKDKKSILCTERDIFKSLLNNIDLYRAHTTEFVELGAASTSLLKRLEDLNDEIDLIPDDPEDGNSKSDITYLFHTYKER
ncbi:hypothetical protein FACS1894191_4330 [Clostridia bacterium]|nr:hypothetical protein FACS1894191_4330 [Clostridia bacterium]